MCVRLHKNHRENQVLEQKEQVKLPVPETQYYILHLFSQSKKQNIQAQV